MSFEDFPLCIEINGLPSAQTDLIFREEKAVDWKIENLKSGRKWIDKIKYQDDDIR